MPHDYIAARVKSQAKAALPPRVELWVKYARKSTESSERQALSIPSQIEQMDVSFPDLNTLDEPIRESKSAFRPGRKKFNWIVEQVEASEISGIIAWHPNRLSRNTEDAATIVRLVKAGKLDLKFVTFSFEKSPEGLWLLKNMLSQGEYESEKLAREVDRGQSKKVDQGWYPGPVPIGYKTDGNRKRKGDRAVVTDEGRLSIVERAMNHALTGNYTIAELQRLMAEEWGLTTRNTERRSSRPITYSTAFNIFRNVFYTGHFLWKGELREGKHRAIITLQQYERLQELMRHSSHGNTRRLTNRPYIKFSGLLMCGPCGRVVTATEKRKHYAGTNRDAIYVYYHCSRNSKIRFCVERPISEPKLINAILDSLAGYRVISEFRDQAINLLIKDFQSKHKGQIAELKEHREELARLEKRDLNLTDMRAAGEIDKEDYRSYHGQYKKQIDGLKAIIVKNPEMGWNVLASSIRAVHFASNLRSIFLDSDGATQRRALIELADSLVLEHGKVLLKAKKWFQPISDSFNFEEAAYELARTSDFGSGKQKVEVFASTLSLWCRRMKAIADLIEEEVENGRVVHAEVKLPAELQARLDVLRPFSESKSPDSRT
ncbi:recombinase family protein [Streptomyces sp. So13.3]|uniref:recombinase family protein n=1 Tax=Streptomyces sp. So13.3 TaxID=2136173 RepID=UPI0011060AE8|nr:recombinase family protein [Streptomyces sp. So13.3]QNA75359.1 recombinase family protein [Streptomyces sp. So13.3]